MKNWKLLLGLGGACAVCCAVPLASAFAALSAVGAGVPALYPSVALPLAGVALVAILAGAARVAWLRRRHDAPSPACGCGSAKGCGS